MRRADRRNAPVGRAKTNLSGKPVQNQAISLPGSSRRQPASKLLVLVFSVNLSTLYEVTFHQCARFKSQWDLDAYWTFISFISVKQFDFSCHTFLFSVTLSSVLNENKIVKRLGSFLYNSSIIIQNIDLK